MEIEKFKYELFNVDGLMDSQFSELWYQLTTYKRIIIDKLQVTPIFKERFVIGWRLGEAYYRTFEIKLKQNIIEVYLV